jgi:hypothetical protein
VTAPPRYEQPASLTRADAERAFADSGGDVVTLSKAIVGAALSVNDGAWLREALAAFLTHASPTIRSAAARGLGHVARLHGDSHVIGAQEMRALLEPLLQDAATRGAARDALDDVDVFCR